MFKKKSEKKKKKILLKYFTKIFKLIHKNN